MKKLFDTMFERQVGDGEIGGWSIKNCIKIWEPIFEKLSNAKWQEWQQGYLRPKYLEKISERLSIPLEELEEWMNEEEFQGLRDRTMRFRLLVDSELELKTVICNELGLRTDDCDIRWQPQRPGEILAWHMDAKKYSMFGLTEDQEYRCRRFAIFPQDQMPGQVWQMHTDYVRWSRGDVLSWDEWRIPHGTANFGYHTRDLLVVTGVMK